MGCGGVAGTPVERLSFFHTVIFSREVPTRPKKVVEVSGQALKRSLALGQSFRLYAFKLGSLFTASRNVCIWVWV